MKHMIALPWLLAASLAQAAPPADPAPAGTVVRLSAEQIAAIEAAHLKRSQADAPVSVEAGRDASPAAGSATNIVDATPQRNRRPHGEIGFGVGTGGYSELFGTVVTPLGDEGFAAFSFSQQRDNRRKRTRQRP